MDILIELIEYNMWANRRIMSQVLDLAHESVLEDPFGCRNSIRAVLLHMVKADWIWLDLWRGKAIIDYPPGWDEFSLDEIAPLWNQLQSTMLDQLRTLGQPGMSLDLDFSNGDERLSILKFERTIMMVVNHDTYYRGEIANLIDLLGYEPVRTHLFDFYTRLKTV
ncbi:MAG TPA: DinB family protein [Chryseolinea sp.]|nr:DinB family protein [Chryseolinea sp.]